MSKTQKRSEARAAASVILERCRPLQPLTAEHVAAVIGPWTAAGWAPGDVLWALNHQPPGPDGRCRLHGYTAGVRHPAAWLAHRLSLWTTVDGAPLTAPSRRHAAERARDRADARDRRAQRQRAAQARLAGGDVDARGATLARQLLAGRNQPIRDIRPGRRASTRQNARFSPGPAEAAARPAPEDLATAADARAWIHRDLLGRLDDDVGALIRATRHREREPTAGPAQQQDTSGATRTNARLSPPGG